MNALRSVTIGLLTAGAFAPLTAFAQADNATADNITAAYEEDGKFFTEDDVPTFNVTEEGTVDWYTFSGFRRYNAECSVCHGPDGQGSSFAPALAESVFEMDYYAFVDVVVNGRVNGNRVMPSFGDNQNVMCYLDDIYVYLRAMGAGAIPRGRPAGRADKPDAFTEAENACMG